MNLIESRFEALRRQGKKAFIAYLTGGDPNLAATEKLIVELDRRGTDVIEIGVPFSDPLADGATIQAASERALARGATLAKLLALSRRLKGKISAPLVFMSYFNPIYRYGCERFAGEARDSGVSGVIVPDLPPEEAGELIGPCRRSNVATIFLASPTSSKKRLQTIAQASQGFIYYVSLTGVTGARDALPRELASGVRALKQIIRKPVCVGFGVKRPEQAAFIKRFADGVIVGSSIVSVVQAGGGRPGVVGAVGRFAEKFVRVLHG